MKNPPSRIHARDCAVINSYCVQAEQESDLDLLVLFDDLAAADRRTGATFEVLNPWTIEGRYPADLPDSDRSVMNEVFAAARRILDAATADPEGGVQRDV